MTNTQVLQKVAVKMPKKRRSSMVKLPLINIVLTSLLFALFYILGNGQQLTNNLLGFAIVVCLSFIINLITLNEKRYRIRSFVVIFVFLLYLFNFGQVIVFGFFPNYVPRGSNFIEIGKGTVENALIYSYFIVNVIVSGILFVPRMKRKLKAIKRNTFEIIMFAFLFISLPMEIYYVLRLLIISRSLGYDATLHNDFGGWFVQIASFYIVGFAMLLRYIRNKRLAFIVYFLEMLFLLVGMLSGSRIYFVAGALTISLIYFEKKRIKPLFVILGLVVLYFLMQFVVALSAIRNTGMNAALIVKTMFSSSNNVFLNILEEFGSSIHSTTLCMQQVPSDVPFAFGTTYLKSLLGVFPNLPGIDIFSIVDSSNFITQLYGTAAMGGNLIGELYFNFGFYLSIPFAFLIGLVCGNISRLLSLANQKRYRYSLIFPILVMVVYTHIIWVRGYYSGIVRSVVWLAIIVILLNYLLKGKRRIKNARN